MLVSKVGISSASLPADAYTFPRDIEDSFRRAYWSCFRIPIECRADDTISVGKVRKEDVF